MKWQRGLASSSPEFQPRNLENTADRKIGRKGDIVESYMKGNWFTYFPDNYRWSAGLIIALGTAPWGSSDLGEVDVTV